MHIIILTESRYVNPKLVTPYIGNIFEEEMLLAKALLHNGISSSRKSWDDSTVDWTQPDAIIFRTTWDYFERFTAFSKWLNIVSKCTQLINSEAIIRWNIDKHYLLDLKAKGTAICKSYFIEKGTKITLQDAYNYLNCKDVILKPCVSGAARHTYKLNRNTITKHETVFKNLIAQEAMMLQPFQYSIVEKGEVSFMVFGGIYSHAILKKAKQGDFRVQDDFGGTIHLYNPSKEDIAFVEQAVRHCPELPLYARVDVMWSNTGQLVVSELELIEPELWFRKQPESAMLLAKAIKTKLM